MSDLDKSIKYNEDSLLAHIEMDCEREDVPASYWWLCSDIKKLQTDNKKLIECIEAISDRGFVSRKFNTVNSLVDILDYHKKYIDQCLKELEQSKDT